MVLSHCRKHDQETSEDGNLTSSSAINPHQETNVLYHRSMYPFSKEGSLLKGSPIFQSSERNPKIMTRDPEKPKRCLTAYNCFFREERQRLLAQLPTRSHVKSKKAHGKISFENLGKTISRNWKKITPEQKKYYKELAAKDKQRYLDQMEEWRALLAERENEANKSSSPHATDTPVVIRGSVLMDNSVVSPVVSQDVSPIVSDVSYDNTIDPVDAVDAIDEQDIMYTMPTEELMELAVTGTSVFTFDNPKSNTSTISLDSETGRSDSEVFKTPNLEHYLDTDCKDFLVSAFT